MASAATIGLSVAMGLALFTMTMFLGWIHQKQSVDANFLKWILLPIFGQGAALALNSFTQFTVCGEVNPGSVAKTSTTVLGAIFAGLAITLIGLLRAPIEAAVPLKQKLQQAGVIALSYQMFWAGMFGEAFASGFALSCPKK